MKEEFLKQDDADGEIELFASNPEAKGKGYGSFLLERLEDLERGKLFYLFTDDACAYGFYEKKNFDRLFERKIVMDLPKGKVDLRCFLHTKYLGSERQGVVS